MAALFPRWPAGTALILATMISLAPAGVAEAQTMQAPPPGTTRSDDPERQPLDRAEVPPATAVPRQSQDGGAKGSHGGLALAGTLPPEAGWAAYRARFITEAGRVIDTANGGISHSEGQGYGMLLAVAAGDRATFERVWGWTRANLMVRPDELIAWRWSPEGRPAVSDMNNATDGEILVAWALTEAAEAWGEPSYRTAARRIAVEFGRRTILFKSPMGPLILPAVAGFSAGDRSDGPLINLSYWVFPAFSRLSIVAAEYDWAAISRSGLALLRKARFGPSSLPTEWVSAAADPLKPAEGFPPLFSYNSIRIPLYLVWAGVGRPSDIAAFRRLWSGADRERLPIVDTRDGSTVEWLNEPGYTALGALLACANDNTPFPSSLATVHDRQNYYPATLHLLSLVAARMRQPSCVKP